jgi:hypothetical protein
MNTCGYIKDLQYAKEDVRKYIRNHSLSPVEKSIITLLNNPNGALRLRYLYSMSEICFRIRDRQQSVERVLHECLNEICSFANANYYPDFKYANIRYVLDTDPYNLINDTERVFFRDITYLKELE